MSVLRPAADEPDATPGPQASLPGMGAWSADDDGGLVVGPRAVFSTNPPGRAATELPSIGQIGRYALKYRVGEGGLGTVYAAHDPTLSRLVAIKTVNVDVPADERESFNALFLNEARAAASLSHPNIVTVFDAGLADGGAYIAMELLKGVGLSLDLCKTFGSSITSKMFNFSGTEDNRCFCKTFELIIILLRCC